jgi:kumamolisin
MSRAAFDGNVFVPQSSVEHGWDIGLRAHTNHLVYVGPEFYPSQESPLLAELQLPSHGPAATLNAGPAGFHPYDLQRAYGDHSNGSGVIAIVDAFHYPNALQDFNTFSGSFGLPNEPSTNATAATNHVFQVVYASGAKPVADGGWSQEMALDIEWAHAMAPSAKIVLVEAASSGFSDLMHAVDVAVAIPGVSQVSMSWGGSEFSSEALYDAHLNHAGVTFFASSGDVGGEKTYPAMSPNVVAVGGTSLALTSSSMSEKGWAGSGGGQSQVEHTPSFQSVIASITSGRRGAPDISAEADPLTGVAVYDSFAYQGFVGWFVVGGTSVACPVCAGIANAGGVKRGSGESAYIYSHSNGFNDITKGSAGANACKAGWDFVTGWGSPKSAASL